MAEFKHRKLEIWQVARALVKSVYLLTKGFPADERFSLTDQIRRAVVSVPSNIAEGSSRGTSSDFAHFLAIARGSLAEVDTQLTLAEDLGYVAPQAEMHAKIESLAAQISSLTSYLRNPENRPTRKPPPPPTH